MPTSPVPGRASLPEVTRALARALQGSLDARGRAALRPFASYARRLAPAGERALGRFARAQLAGVSALLAARDDRVRHAAAYALGHSQDERAVEPLMGLLCRQHDFHDHDFAYAALRRLGRRALGRLERFALEGSEEEAFQAVQALGQSSADALPCLRRVLGSRSPLPESFFTAYYNLRDPRGLPDLLPPIQSSDPRSRRDALFAAAALLEEASKRSVRRPRRAAAFADAIAPLLESDDWDLRGPALECLGRLCDTRYLWRLEALSNGPDTRTATHAIEAIAGYRTAAARAHLVAVLAHDDLERATTAATCLLDDRRATRAAKRRATAVAVRGLATLPGDAAWCSASILCRRSLRLRRAVCEAIRAGKGKERRRLVQALIRMVPPRPPWRRVFERRLLATCGPDIRPLVAKAISARIARLGW